MNKIHDFNEYNQIINIFGDSQIGPVEILSTEHIKDDEFYIATSMGKFHINQKLFPDLKFTGDTLLNPMVGRNYVFKVTGNSIVDIAIATCDLLIVYNGPEAQILSIKRKNDPFKGYWANPGGFIDEGEQPLDAAVRELREETSLQVSPDDLDFVGKFDKEGRDPRMKKCVSYAYIYCVDEKPEVSAQDDADDITWLTIDLDYNGGNNHVIRDDSGNPVQMAFDHFDIIKQALDI